jgi:CRISPR-associated protein Csm4
VLLLVRLKFKSALRIGSGETTQDDEFQGILHSDTLFSALMNEWVRLFPDGEVDKLVADIPFKLSSAFPYYMNEYYLPTPIGTGKLYMEKLRDAPFLELYDFLDLAQGNDKGILKKELKNPVDEMMFSLTVPRVSIDRMSAATNIFESSGWLFKDGGGLYFLAELKDEAFKDKFELCMRLLGQSGLGADRSIGYGLFESEIESIDTGGAWTDLFRKRHGEKTAYCTLSLIYPSKEEAKEALLYKAFTRRGWIFSRSSTVQMKRRVCKMLAEGSLFRAPIKGQIADVTPSEFQTEHTVYRYGLGMMVHLKI